MRSGTVIDTSVMLNLLGSGHAETILRAMSGRRIVIHIASGEVLRHPLPGHAAGAPLEPLLGANLLEQVALPAEAHARFIEFTGADPPDDLDDGEAASMAAAEHLGLAVALDERKGRRVARERIPRVAVISSIDIFAMTAVKVALGHHLEDAVFSACFHARMRVLPEHEEWVRKLLGPTRAAQCPSLRRRT